MGRIRGWAENQPKATWVVLFILVAAVCAVAAFMLSRGAARQSQWIIDDSASKLDGRRTYKALLQSQNSVANLLDNQEKATLGFECAPSGFSAMVRWPDFIDQADSIASIGWRADDGPVHRERWAAAEQGTGPVGSEAHRFLYSIARAKRLVVSVPDHHGGSEAVFELSGISDVLAHMQRVHCA